MRRNAIIAIRQTTRHSKKKKQRKATSNRIPSDCYTTHYVLRSKFETLREEEEEGEEEVYRNE